MISQDDNRYSSINRISGLKLQDPELDSILESHPYFQLGLVEKSRRLRRQNHIDAIKYARKCAILFPNRSILYQLIHESASEQSKELPGSDSIPFNTAETQVQEKKEIKEKVNLDIVETEEEVNPLGSSSITNENSGDSTLEKEYLVEAINQSIQLETESYIIEEHFPEEEKNELSEISSPRSDISKILSFSEWIKDEEDQIENKNTFKAELIDRFIQESPQISRIQDKVFYSPIEKGKASLSENDLPYSETLASIFVEQGNKDLAIKAYTHLMLKNPQKSVYFADLIKKLEEKFKKE